MAIILKANKVNVFVSSVLFVFWYHSPNVLGTLHTCNISWLRVKRRAILMTLKTKASWLIKALQNICHAVGGGSSGANDCVQLTPTNTQNISPEIARGEASY
jgi:hypothetical protein